MNDVVKYPQSFTGSRELSGSPGPILSHDALSAVDVETQKLKKLNQILSGSTTGIQRLGVSRGIGLLLRGTLKTNLGVLQQ